METSKEFLTREELDTIIKQKELKQIKDMRESYQHLTTELLYHCKRAKAKTPNGYIITNLHLAALVVENNEFVAYKLSEREVELSHRPPYIYKIGTWRNEDVYVDQNMRWDNTAMMVVDRIDIEDYKVIYEIKCKISL